MSKNIITVESDIKKQVWIWTGGGDKLKIDCPDEEHGFIPIAAYHCCNHKKSDEILKPFHFNIDRVRDCNL